VDSLEIGYFDGIINRRIIKKKIIKESTAKPKFDLIMELNQPTLPTNNTPKKKKAYLYQQLK